MLREINSKVIEETIAQLCIKANKNLPCDIANRINDALMCETNPLAKSILSDIKENVNVADEYNIPICQDTGMAVVFAEVGQDVHIVGDNFETAVNDGVKEGYEKGLLRKSVVKDPLDRVNTDDNTPAIIHIKIVPGNKIKLTVAPKGFGSENMSSVRMLKPSDGRDGVINAVLDIVKNAGSNPCPPIVVGVGIGGDFEYAALLSKKALCRNTDNVNANPFYAQLEKDLLREINALGIGAQGFGGNITALAVNIEVAATHIAGLPVAVNIGCHVTRHASAEI